MCSSKKVKRLTWMILRKILSWSVSDQCVYKSMLQVSQVKPCQNALKDNMEYQSWQTITWKNKVCLGWKAWRTNKARWFALQGSRRSSRSERGEGQDKGELLPFPKKTLVYHVILGFWKQQIDSQIIVGWFIFGTFRTTIVCHLIWWPKTGKNWILGPPWSSWYLPGGSFWQQKSQGARRGVMAYCIPSEDHMFLDVQRCWKSQPDRDDSCHN